MLIHTKDSLFFWWGTLFFFLFTLWSLNLVQKQATNITKANNDGFKKLVDFVSQWMLCLIYWIKNVNENGFNGKYKHDKNDKIRLFPLGYGTWNKKIVLVFMTKEVRSLFCKIKIDVWTNRLNNVIMGTQRCFSVVSINPFHSHKSILFRLTFLSSQHLPSL